MKHKNLHTKTSLSYTCISIQPAAKTAEHFINSYELLLLILEKETETINTSKDQQSGGGINEEENASLALAVGKSVGLGGTEWL